MEVRIETVCLVVIATVLGAAALYWLRPVMIPFVLAIFISLALSALANTAARRFRMPRFVTLIGAAIVSGVFFAGIAAVVMASVTELAQNAGSYQAKATRLIEQILASSPWEIPMLESKEGRSRLAEIPMSTVGGVLLGTTNAIADILSRSLLVAIFVIYLVLGSRSGAERSPRPSQDVWTDIELRISGYLVTKALISGATGVLVGLTLALLGVDLALVFGLFAFLLNFIPSIGSIIATLLPLPIVLASDGLSTGAAVAAIAIPGAIQITIGNFVEPRIMGGSLDLHPVVILLSLIFWGMLWGIVGMLLATPLMAVLKILLDRFEPSRPLAELLAGRLAPVRSD